MGNKNLDQMTPFKRWNALRSALSKEIKKSGVKLPSGQYDVICRQIYHGTKDQPFSKVVKQLPDLATSRTTRPRHPFTNPIPFYHIEHESETIALMIPTNVWIDSTAINNGSYYPSEFKYDIFRPIVNSINSWYNRINDSTDSRMPHFLLTQPSWNAGNKRWESVWIITDATGGALEDFEYDPDEDILESVPEEEEIELPTEPEPEPEPEQPTTYRPEVDKAEAKAITDKNTRENIKLLEKRESKLLKELKAYKDIPELYKETIQDIKEVKAKIRELTGKL